MFNVKKEDKKLKDYTFIDLFSGIGGFHYALQSFGAKCVFASEIDNAASDVYLKNFGIKPDGDIRKISEEDIPKHDIICGGFPCQPFSISGNKKGFDDKNGKLFFEIVRVAKYHEPKLIILENVNNIIAHDNGKTIKRIENCLQNIGYSVYRDTLCATNFQVPQSRKRLYIVAFREDLNVKGFVFPKGRGTLKCVEDILENEVDSHYIINKDYFIKKEYTSKIKSKKIERIGSVGEGRQGERVYSIKGQGITLSAQGGGLAGKTGMYLIEGNVRKLTPRECARMMGFPEKFILSDKESDCYHQFGNSVVVNVIQEIVREAINYL